MEDVNGLVGRVLAKDGQNYTVQSASTYGAVHVWDPVTQTLTPRARASRDAGARGNAP